VEDVGEACRASEVAGLGRAQRQDDVFGGKGVVCEHGAECMQRAFARDVAGGVRKVTRVGGEPTGAGWKRLEQVQDAHRRVHHGERIWWDHFSTETH
jgi:hypothetical protein